MAAMRPDVLTDPIAVVVDLVAGYESTLDHEAVRAAVTGMAGGRTKQRRLARALADRPTLLIEGRSPAPRAVGDLLLALRTAGAGGISPP